MVVHVPLIRAIFSVLHSGQLIRPRTKKLPRQSNVLQFSELADIAGLAELADAPDSKSGDRKVV
jgi:hypothetical protein